MQSVLMRRRRVDGHRGPFLGIGDPDKVGEWSRARQRSGDAALFDYSGAGNRIKFGGVDKAVIADTVYGDRGLITPGIAGNSASTPHSAVLNVVNLDVYFRVRSPDWTPTATQMFFSKDNGGSARSWNVLRLGSGQWRLYWWEADATFRFVNFDVDTLSDMTAQWVRVQLLCNDGAGGHVATLKLGGSGAAPTWAQWGATKNAGAFTTSIRNTTMAVYIAQNSIGDSPAVATFYRAVQLSDIDGSVVLDTDDIGTLGQGTRTWVSSTGQTFTVNTAGNSTAEPTQLFLQTQGVTAWFPGTASNGVTIAGLSNSTLYNFQITYGDGTTDTDSGTTDGSGNLVLGTTDAKFATKYVARILETGSGVFDVKFTNRAAYNTSRPGDATSLKAETGQDVAINRIATGLKTTIVDESTEAPDGVDDYGACDETDAHDVSASESITVSKRFRVWATPAAEGVVIGKKSGIATANAGWQITVDASRKLVARVTDGTNVATVTSTAALTAGHSGVATLRLDRAMGKLSLFLDAEKVASDADASAVGSLSNAIAIRIGSGGGGANFLAYQGADTDNIVKRALTDGQILQVAREMGAAI